MITKKVWFAIVGAFGGGAAVLLSIANGFVPHTEDLVDPLGRPSELSLQVIHSASEFDRLSATLVPKHGDLGGRIGVLQTVADDLDGIVGKAGDLVPSAQTVNAGTTSVQGVATPLPALIDKVTGRAKEATPVVKGLGDSVGSVASQLATIGGSLNGVRGDLAALGPRADLIVAILKRIEDESARVRPVSPLLALLSQLTNGPSQPNTGLLGLGK